ncbi:DUF4347 domain-containing protein [Rubripirellula lacrimiformis]|nr:DUF4347 domain-containing protein [Rubripirellula lacrimiformis]
MTTSDRSRPVRLWQPVDDRATVSGEPIEMNSDGPATRLPATRRELVIVDRSAADYEKLVEDVMSQADEDRVLTVVLLDADRDGVEQVSRILATRSELSALHIVSHSEQGALRLGNLWANPQTMMTNAGPICLWGNALGQTGQIILYGCDLDQSSEGRDLIADLSALTGADIVVGDQATITSHRRGDRRRPIANGAERELDNGADRDSNNVAERPSVLGIRRPEIQDVVMLAKPARAETDADADADNETGTTDPVPDSETFTFDATSVSTGSSTTYCPLIVLMLPANGGEGTSVANVLDRSDVSSVGMHLSISQLIVADQSGGDPATDTIDHPFLRDASGAPLKVPGIAGESCVGTEAALDFAVCGQFQLTGPMTESPIASDNIVRKSEHNFDIAPLDVGTSADPTIQPPNDRPECEVAQGLTATPMDHTITEQADRWHVRKRVVDTEYVESGRRRRDSVVGDLVNYHITVDVPNNGASNLQLTDVLPAGLSYVGATIETSPGLRTSIGSFDDVLNNASITGAAVPWINDGRKISFNFGDVHNRSRNRSTTEQIRVNVTTVIVKITKQPDDDNQANRVQVPSAAVAPQTTTMTTTKTTTPDTMVRNPNQVDIIESSAARGLPTRPITVLETHVNSSFASPWDSDSTSAVAEDTLAIWNPLDFGSTVDQVTNIDRFASAGTIESVTSSDICVASDQVQADSSVLVCSLVNDAGDERAIDSVHFVGLEHDDVFGIRESDIQSTTDEDRVRGDASREFPRTKHSGQERDVGDLGSRSAISNHASSQPWSRIDRVIDVDDCDRRWPLNRSHDASWIDCRTLGLGRRSVCSNESG